MISTIIDAPTLAHGIKYPAPVKKAYDAQLDAEQKYINARQELTEAEAGVSRATEQDRGELLEAAEKGTGPLKRSRVDQAERDRDYADRQAVNAQDHYLLTAETTRHALAAHVEEMIPTAITFLREAAAGYQAHIDKARTIIQDANAGIQNATHALNQLSRFYPHSNYTVNWVPPTLQLDEAGRIASILATASRLEQQSAQVYGTAEPKPISFPGAITERSMAAGAIYADADAS